MEEEINMHLFSTDECSKQLFTTFYPSLCLFANRLLNNFDEAEDIVQNVFITLLHKKVKVNQITSLKAYLYSSVHNACINHIKRLSLIHIWHFFLRKNVTIFLQQTNRVCFSSSKTWRCIA